MKQPLLLLKAAESLLLQSHDGTASTIATAAESLMLQRQDGTASTLLLLLLLNH